MLNKLSVRELPLHMKKVLVRVDFNVPLDEQNSISDDTRILASIPTINYILSHGGSVILMSHLGRPKGERRSSLSLAGCAKHLSFLLGKEVIMAPDVIGSEVKGLVNRLQPGEVLLLENLRFYPAEENPDEDPNFVSELASFADFFVNDAFGASHRKHSSTVKITSFFPNSSAAGFLLEKELSFLGEKLLNPAKPFYSLIGGAKVSSKLGVIHSLIQKVDGLAIFGGMAFTFLKALGISIGDSLIEENYIDTAREILDTCYKAKVKCILPNDFLCTKTFSNDSPIQYVEASSGIPTGSMALDIGPDSIQGVKELIHDAQTIFWNGPAGVFEFSNFAKGTQSIAQFLANSSATTIVGGGDSIAALNVSGLSSQINHISTGGGASLEFIEFGDLPAIEALSKSPNGKILAPEV
jgi:phosphoglycerate kinase